jgi:hypothetical protein
MTSPPTVPTASRIAFASTIASRMMRRPSVATSERWTSRPPPIDGESMRGREQRTHHRARRCGRGQGFGERHQKRKDFVVSEVGGQRPIAEPKLDVIAQRRLRKVRGALAIGVERGAPATCEADAEGVQD